MAEDEIKTEKSDKEEPKGGPEPEGEGTFPEVAGGGDAGGGGSKETGAIAGEGEVAFEEEEEELLNDIELPIQVRLGGARITLEEALKLGSCSVIELDKNADEPVEIWIQDNLIAKGEIIVTEDYYAVRIMEIENKKRGSK